MCGPHHRFAPLLPRTLRRIPQAVGTVATKLSLLMPQQFVRSFNTVSGKYCCNKKVYGTLCQLYLNCFNTASGRYCCNEVDIGYGDRVVCTKKFQYRKRQVLLLHHLCFPFLRSGTRDVRISSSLHSSAVSHPSSHTASGKYCCNRRITQSYRGAYIVSIPQAVSTVTSSPLFSLPFGQGLEMCGPHRRSSAASHPSSHTASGRYCCNFRVTYNQNGLIEMFQYRKRQVLLQRTVGSRNPVFMRFQKLVLENLKP